MRFKQFAVGDLKMSAFNPPVRHVQGMPALMKNIKENGLIVPIVIANDCTIVDGHRRYVGMKKLGYEKIPCVQHNTSSHLLYDTMFLNANKDTMQLNGNQYLWRYMQGAVIPDNFLTRIKCLELWLGKRYAKGMFARILDKGHSASTYQNTMGIYRKYTRLTSKKAMKELAYYLLNVGSNNSVKSAVMFFITADALVRFVKNREVIKADFNV